MVAIFVTTNVLDKLLSENLRRNFITCLYERNIPPSYFLYPIFNTQEKVGQCKEIRSTKTTITKFKSEVYKFYESFGKKQNEPDFRLGFLFVCSKLLHHFILFLICPICLDFKCIHFIKMVCADFEFMVYLTF